MSNPKPLLASTPEAVWHEQNRRERLKNTVLSSPDVLINRGNRGFTVRMAQRGGGSSGLSVTQYRLKNADYGDFFVCRELIGSTVCTVPGVPGNPVGCWDSKSGDTGANRFAEGTTVVYIAKPYLLRRYEFDTLTLTVPTEYLDISGPTPILSVTDKFYKYTYYGANFRKVEQLLSVGGAVLATEYQTVLPRFGVNDDIIYAVDVTDLQIAAYRTNAEVAEAVVDDIPANRRGEIISGLAIPDARAWARVLSPTTP